MRQIFCVIAFGTFILIFLQKFGKINDSGWVTCTFCEDKDALKQFQTFFFARIYFYLKILHNFCQRIITRF